MGLSGMPLPPACWIDVLAHLCVEIDDRGKRPPGSPQKNGAGHARVGNELAVVKDEARVLFGIAFRLCGEESAGMRRAMDLAVIENGFAIPKNEVHVPGDEAVDKILPRWNAIL